MPDDYKIVNLEDLAAFVTDAPPRTVKDTVANRAKKEKPTSTLDGRKGKPQSPKQVPLNVDVEERIKQLAVMARAKHGMSMKVFVARAIEHYWQALEAAEDGDEQ